MQTLKLDNVKKLSRPKKRDFFLYIATGKEIQGWHLKSSISFIYKLDGILYITCSEITEKNMNNDCLAIEITDPIIHSGLDEGSLEDEHIIIISLNNIPNSILDLFLLDPKISSIIEIKGRSVSKKSLKVITYKSLIKLISYIFSKSYYREFEIMLELLKEYIMEYFELNSEYYPNSINEMVKIKDEFVIHSVFSWFIILNYFEEQWESYSLPINIPLFSKIIKYKNWSGTFFERSNPLWDEINNNNKRPFYPSKQTEIIIYNKWKELTKPS